MSVKFETPNAATPSPFDVSFNSVGKAMEYLQLCQGPLTPLSQLTTTPVKTETPMKLETPGQLNTKRVVPSATKIRPKKPKVSDVPRVVDDMFMSNTVSPD